MLLAALLTSCTVTVPIGPTETGVFRRDSGFSPRVGGDTGFAWFFWMGAIHAPGGAFSDGYFGLGALGAQEGDFVCMDIGTLDEREAGVDACDGCTYAFGFTVQSSAPVGEFCDAVGLGTTGDLDGMEVAFGWGPETYTFSDSYGTVTLDDPVYMQYGGEWFLFAYSYYGNAYTRVGEDYVSFMHPYFVTYGSGGTSWFSGYYSRT